MNTTFSTDDIRGRAGDTLSTEHVWNVGKAFAEWLPDDGAVVIARTSIDDSEIASALTEGVLLQGRDVINAGMDEPQSTINYMNEKHAAGAAVVSHNDADDLVVITLFDMSGNSITDKNGLNDIAQLMESGNLLPAAKKGTVSSKSD